ncbi:MAG: hypothetical protein KC438_11860, partial [Thermomicrobiales bacterium]|nr:hypothetical protein [Thermomicrobiales bacterium]
MSHLECATLCDTEYTPICIQNRPCDEVIACESNADCGEGGVCVIANCCETPVCTTSCQLGQGFAVTAEET